ncbi:MAG: aryl-sulfate sulfotransferase [Deltaproteobacteria bacterium]|nr:aryl-sulfate sulfotransferase [Deltaproteobacteria bacterium]
MRKFLFCVFNMSVFLICFSNIHAAPIQRELGLVKYNPEKAFQGYTLFAPKHDTKTYLIDMEGRLINSWKSLYEPGQTVFLLNDGNLIHTCFLGRGDRDKTLIVGGEGGRIEEYNWEGDLVWVLIYSTRTYAQHHDIEPMPNGNILLLCVEKRIKDECIAAGMRPESIKHDAIFPEYVAEIERWGASGYEVVWRWHIWDHMVQDFDETKDNFGVVADHPELLDANFHGKEAVPFWNHGNSVDYNPELDQIVISVRLPNELWVIDHSTTSKGAKGHSGGKYGKGGDILYRWGNPSMYKAGDPVKDREFYHQHDAQWVPKGLPGEGNLLVFNNGEDGRGYSSVDEIVPPVDSMGGYLKEPGKAFGPDKIAWSYVAENPEDFYAEQISGCQRLPNGNTLITNGIYGVFFEVTPENDIVWEYVNPISKGGPLKQGDLIPVDQKDHALTADFKVERYPLDYAGLKGRDLAPGEPLIK